VRVRVRGGAGRGKGIPRWRREREKKNAEETKRVSPTHLHARKAQHLPPTRVSSVRRDLFACDGVCMVGAANSRPRARRRAPAFLIPFPQTFLLLKDACGTRRLLSPSTATYPLGESTPASTHGVNVCENVGGWSGGKETAGGARVFFYPGVKERGMARRSGSAARPPRSSLFFSGVVRAFARTPCAPPPPPRATMEDVDTLRAHLEVCVRERAGAHEDGAQLYHFLMQICSSSLSPRPPSTVPPPPRRPPHPWTPC